MYDLVIYSLLSIHHSQTISLKEYRSNSLNGIVKKVALKRRYSSRTFRYGYLVTT